MFSSHFFFEKSSRALNDLLGKEAGGANVNGSNQQPREWGGAFEKVRRGQHGGGPGLKSVERREREDMLRRKKKKKKAYFGS